ncbi:phosphoenolpyruvate synthase [Solirubrobacter phytolaccae]|uniref:Phosphoenolpyruvate synthase n=1 Tax=Solirubrobacter phytolaccae TaxID=1404360 RepID=A0A9X3N8H7_9ACTN|nr:rifamycin-inactivating phosphotransferase [Solirubrobacter phytolaccae]MDA0180360.1 phosphoenolpyruvate synthase [Solirubrobacter phytolaccae]
MAYVVGLDEVDATQVELVGGKGASLGELTRIASIAVPAGFCVTTDAFRASGGKVVAEDVAAAIVGRLDERTAYAVRSSATAEDSATASFAGQHDSYLNVVGAQAVLERVQQCWGSLFTERAVSYRSRSGIDERDVAMAVVVQEMVDPHASGVLFTADPLSGNRTVASVEAVLGLGEALVSGLVNPDVYSVRDGAVSGDGTALTSAQVLRLVELGRTIEAHFGRPQDIEWCLAGDAFAIVQSRPITTLFPIPAVAADGEPHVFVSVGHQQMMTDPIKPLGLSVWQLTAGPPMHEAAGRLFVDVAPRLASPASRAAVVEMIRKGDPLIGDALDTVVERAFVPTVPDPEPAAGPASFTAPASIETDPAFVTELVARSEAAIMALERDIQTHSGPELFAFLRENLQDLKAELFAPLNGQVIMAAMEATWWLNDQLEAWLGEKNAADTLTLSVPGNVTAEMGLALLDVADVIRPYPEVVAFLEDVSGDDFLDALATLDGGPAARDAIQAFLAKNGMRCIGEIDLTRPRWAEHPSALLPAILGHVKHFEPGEAERHFEHGRQAAAAKEREVLERLRALPDGEAKAAETKRMIDRVRTYTGYREYPKYAIVNRSFAYKRALLAEAARLVDAGVLHAVEDCFWLRFEELESAAITHRADHALIAERRRAFATYEALTPPRVLTSEGEAISGSYGREDVPPGALVGLPVSTGTIEGRARVILDIADAEFEPGDILVTAYTDPGWSPVFIAIKGLVTEVGGLMTHGAVIAREYGLPAVVGVEHATQRIRDGQRIRVHGTDGYVELL